MKKYLSTLVSIALILQMCSIGIGAKALDAGEPVFSVSINDTKQTVQLIGSTNFAEGEAGSNPLGQLYVVQIPFGVDEIEITHLDGGLFGEMMGGSQLPPTGNIFALSSLRDGDWLQEMVDGLSTDTLIFIDNQEAIKNENVDSDIFWYSNSEYEGMPVDLLIVQRSTVAGSGELSDAQTALADVIARVSDANVSNWHTSGDRYNGKDIVKDKSSGFWAQLQKLLETSSTYLSPGYSDVAVNTYKRQVEDAIGRLIPISQVNATALYEEVNTAYGWWNNQPRALSPGSNLSPVKEGNTSVVTWRPYQTVLTDGNRLLAGLFHANGTASDENKAENQGAVAAALTAIQDAVSALDRRLNSYETLNSETALAGIRLLLELYDPSKLTASNYTEGSYGAFLAARTAAQGVLETEGQTFAGMGIKQLHTQAQVFTALRNACYGLVDENKTTIKISFSAVDSYAVHEGAAPLTFNTCELTLSAGATIGDALAAAGVNNLETNAWNSKTAVYLNGLLYISDGASLSSGNYIAIAQTYENAKLRDGDALTVARIAPPILRSISSSTADAPKYLAEVKDYVRYQTIEIDPSVQQNIRAGEPFSVSVASKGAMPATYSGAKIPVAGVTFYAGAANADKATAGKTAANIPTYVTTSRNGEAQVTLYGEGWCLINAYSLTDENGGLINGPSVLVYVLPALDLSKIKTKLDTELDTAYQNEKYPRTYFSSEQWTALKGAYDAGVTGIADAATSGDARTAQLSAIQAILAVQKQAEEDNESNLRVFFDTLNRMPDNLEKLDRSCISSINKLKTCYDQMTEYQHGQLTPLQQQRYNAIVAVDTATLQDAVRYTLSAEMDMSLVPEADQSGLTAMLNWLANNIKTDDALTPETGGILQAKLGSFNFTGSEKNGISFTEISSSQAMKNVYVCVSPDYAAWFHVRDESEPWSPSGVTNWSISSANARLSLSSRKSDLVEGLTYTVNGHDYALRSIAVEGLPEGGGTYTGLAFYDTSTFGGKDPASNANFVVPNSFLRFFMPFDNVTVKLQWGPLAGTTQELDSAKEAAKAAIEAAYQKYDLSKYDDMGQQQLSVAKGDGLTAVDTAATLAGVTQARHKALAAMAAVPLKAASGTDELKALFGDIVGQVYIGVENNTFFEGDFEGDLIPNGKYDLRAKDTIMTAMLRALESKGYSWTGTGGVGKYDISYLASVYIDDNGNKKWDEGEKKLGEFDGAPGSGWMVTLNDWFINESMQSFGVEKTNKDYRLENGDVINIVYTQNLGVDVGGTWSNANTSLAALKISGGTLSPTFSGGTLSYTLTILGGRSNVQITPTAYNKNYLVRTFLNTYNSDAAFYKRTETISVKSGDVVYIGCGDRLWPSMNKQETEDIDYTGTMYTIKVFGNDGDGVKDRIAALPSAAAIKYSNYKQYSDMAADIRKAFNTLDDTQKAKVKNEGILAGVEARIFYFTKIDEVKGLLTAIPVVNKLASSDRSKVQAAYDAYSKLNEEQRKYITVSDTKKYNDAVEWLKGQGIDTPGSIDGSDKAPGEEIVVIAPKVTAKDGVAAASVSAADMNKAIADAKKNVSSVIVIEPEVSGEARKSTVELPKAALSEIAAQTDAVLQIILPTGGVTIPNEVLSSLASQAGGSTITVLVAAAETKTLTTEQQKAVGDGPVFDISILSGGKYITSFGGKSITISLPYTLKTGEKSEGVAVWYLSDAGKLERITCKYDRATGLATFTTNHLSHYVVGYDAWVNPFTDVKAGEWFYDAVKYAAEKELFNGTSATTFGPSADMTRAMLVTVLYRLEGKPAVTAATGFTDVKAGQWYTDAVLWANENKLVEGYGNGLFGTGDPITREQMAAILYRYAQMKGYDISQTTAMAGYTDAASVSAWAAPAMKWAVANGFITGTSATMLSPTGTASRAQVATILMRFMENAIK